METISILLLIAAVIVSHLVAYFTGLIVGTSRELRDAAHEYREAHKMVVKSKTRDTASPNSDTLQ